MKENCVNILALDSLSGGFLTPYERSVCHRINFDHPIEESLISDTLKITNNLLKAYKWQRPVMFYGVDRLLVFEHRTEQGSLTFPLISEYKHPIIAHAIQLFINN